ncbi:MAG: PAS domain S-box protein [Calditrichaeota bacterium]|nr:PAS domain S-box protein [Calditrichota bacterium]
MLPDIALRVLKHMSNIYLLPQKLLACAARTRPMNRAPFLALLFLGVSDPAAAEGTDYAALLGFWPAVAGLALAVAILMITFRSVRAARQTPVASHAAPWNILANNIEELVVLLDKSDRMVYINRESADHQNALGQPMDVFLDPEDFPRWSKFFQTHKSRTGADTPEIFKVRLPNGAAAYWEIRLSHLYVEELNGVSLCCSRDVTRERRRRLELDVLNKIADLSSREEALDVVVHEAAEQLGRVLNARNFYLALYDPTTGLYSKPIERDEADEQSGLQSHLDLNGGLTDFVRRTGKTLLLNDENRARLIQEENLKSLGTPAKCWLGVPLVAGDLATGVFVLQSYDNEQEYSEQDAALLEVISGHIGRTVERQRATLELREREAKLRLLTERMPALLWTQNLDGEVSYVAGTALGQLEHTPESLIGKDLLDILTPQECDKQAILNKLSERQNVSLQLVSKKRTLEAYLEPIESSHGVVVGAIGVALDVTESARKDEELRRFFNVSADAYLVSNDRGIVLECNEAFERILGYEAGAAKGICTFDLIHPDDVALCRSAAEDLLLGDPQTGVEARFRHTDGSYRWMSWNGAASGEDRTFSSGKDITYRRNIEHALRVREEQMRIFVENSPAPMAMFDRDLRYMIANKKWYQAYRLTQDSVIGKSHYDVFPEISERWKEIHQRCLAGASESCAKDPFPRADGSTDYVRWTVRPWHAEDGSIGGVIMLTEVITAEVQAEADLLHSKTLARKILDASLDAVVAMDHRGLVTEWNPKAEEIFGYSKQEAIGNALHALIIPERLRDSHLRGMKTFLETGHGPALNQLLKLSARRKDGSEFPVELAISPIETGQHPHFAGVIRDISLRQAREQEILESREKLKEAQAIAGLGFWEWFPATDELYVSDEKLNMYARPELHLPITFAQFLEIIHPEDREVFVNTASEMMEGREEFELEYRIVRPTGEHRNLVSKGRVRRTEDGVPYKVFGSTLDITERVRTEKRVQESEQRLAFVIDGSNDAYWDLNCISGDCYCSPRLVEWLEYDETDFKHEADFINSHVVPEYMKAYNDAFLEHAAGHAPLLEAEVLLKTAKGNSLWLHARGKIVEWNDDGTPLRCSGVSSNITDRKNSEAAMHELEVQLRHAQRLETVGTLAGGIAHDFNNILTPILGYADMIASEFPEDTSVRQDIEQVIKAAYRAKSLVQQILAFSRRGEQRPQPLRMDLLVKEVLKLLQSSLPANVELVQNIQPVGMILSDPTQIHQVVMNLCTNSLHALKTNGGILEVELIHVLLEHDDLSCTNSLVPGKYAKLTVTDNGIGMDEQTSARVFEPFFTTKEVGQGTGLGLPVVHGIITSHKGAIQLHSQPASGTKVVIWLPIEAAEVDVLQSPVDDVIKGSEHVLLCDDDETIVLLGKQMLESYGYEVTAFCDPIQALAALQETARRVDVMIVDDIMPLMSGTDVALAAKDFDSALPVILLASGGVEDERGKGLFASITHKPVNSTELAAAVRAAISTNHTFSEA